MALSIINNLSSLVAQQGFSRNSSALTQSLTRLSTGLRLNRGADDPAALVMSSMQQSEISGLQAAISNTNRAVAMVQTGDSALGQINALLNTVRGLAVDSANTGLNDPAAIAANQVEIDNALASIDRISASTQFGGKKLFDGSASVSVGQGASGQSLAFAHVSTGTLGAMNEGSETSAADSSLASLHRGGANDVTTPGANAVQVIDAAIAQVAGMRGNLGAFQSNALEVNAQHVRDAFEDGTAFESTISDTDFAAETANVSRQQVLLQAGTTVLANANTSSQLVLSLLH